MAGAWPGAAMYPYASAASVKDKSNMAGAAMYYSVVGYPYVASAWMLRYAPKFAGNDSWLFGCDGSQDDGSRQDAKRPGKRS